MPTIAFETGRTYVTTAWFDFIDGNGTTWGVPADSRLVLLAHRKDDSWRVRCGTIEFNLSAAMLARVTATTEGK